MEPGKLYRLKESFYVDEHAEGLCSSGIDIPKGEIVLLLSIESSKENNTWLEYKFVWRDQIKRRTTALGRAAIAYSFEEIL